MVVLLYAFKDESEKRQARRTLSTLDVAVFDIFTKQVLNGNSKKLSTTQYAILGRNYNGFFLKDQFKPKLLNS